MFTWWGGFEQEWPIFCYCRVSSGGSRAASSFLITRLISCYLIHVSAEETLVFFKVCIVPTFPAVMTAYHVIFLLSLEETKTQTLVLRTCGAINLLLMPVMSFQKLAETSHIFFLVMNQLKKVVVTLSICRLHYTVYDISSCKSV